MENLKISFDINSPLLLDRFTTIDSILLRQYFLDNDSDGNIDALDCKFIEQKNKTLSGSIWFVDEDEMVYYNSDYITKKTEHQFLNDNRKKKKKYQKGSGNFKNFLIYYNFLIVKRIYFYISGDYETISKLAKKIKYIGKKSSIGFGEVKSVKIEKIEVNKGFLLDAKTPSRPLPLSFDLKNNKIAYWNATPPYHEKFRHEVCYMPMSPLIETLYNKDTICKMKNSKYIGSCEFMYNLLGENKDWRPYKVDDELLDEPKKNKKFQIVVNEENICAFDGVKSERGKKGNLKSMLSNNFNDFMYCDRKHNNFISEATLWVIKNGATGGGKPVLGFHVADEDGITFIRGKNKSSTISDALSKAKVPFNFAIKTTANNQHVVFKSKLSLSKECIAMQYGNDTFYFDIDEAKKCANEAQEILKQYPLTISILIASPDISRSSTRLSKKAKESENIYKIISDFYKKYDKNIRAGAYVMMEK